MSQFTDLSAHRIQMKFKLPKLTAEKIAEARDFVQQQNESLGSNENKNLHFTKSEQKLKKGLNSKTLRTLKRVTTLQKALEAQRQLVVMRMKKFKPINGSFSKYYSQQLSLNSDRGGSSPLKIKIPEIDLNQLTSKELTKTSRNMLRKNNNSTPFIKAHTHLKQAVYLEKINSIRQTSQALNANSKYLLKKANIVSQANKNSYERLANETLSVLLDEEEEKVVLDEQLSNTYKRIVKEGNTRWKSRK